MTKYNEKIANTICDRLSEGESLLKICRSLKINHSTVFRWVWSNPEFADMYNLARQNQADYYNERIRQISDDVLEGKTNVNAARLAIDALKWQAGKQKPKSYGDKLDLNQTGNVTIEVINYADKTI